MPFRQSQARVRGSALLAALVGVALLCAACSSNSSSPTTTAGGATGTTSGAPVTLQLGYLTNLTHAPALIGVQEGIFTKHLPTNVTLQTSTYNAGPAEVTALLAGSLDAAYMGPNSAINAYSHRARPSGSSRVPPRGGRLWWSRPRSPPPASSRARPWPPPSSATPKTSPCAPGWPSRASRSPVRTAGSGEVTILPEANATTVTSFEAGTIAGGWVPEPYAAEMVAKAATCSSTRRPCGHRGSSPPRCWWWRPPSWLPMQALSTT